MVEITYTKPPPISIYLSLHIIVYLGVVHFSLNYFFEIDTLLLNRRFEKLLAKKMNSLNRILHPAVFVLLSKGKAVVEKQLVASFSFNKEGSMVQRYVRLHNPSTNFLHLQRFSASS